MKLPLILTLLRFILSPLFVALYLYGARWGLSLSTVSLLLLLVVIVCEVSDALDGFLARKNNQVTNLGKVLDPMADSFFRLSVFFTFTQGVLQIPLGVVIIFFWRDCLVNALRALFALEGVPLAARMSGKIKAIFQAITIILTLLLMIVYAQHFISLETLQRLSSSLTLITAFYTVGSGCEYLWVSRSFLQKAIGMNCDKR